MPKNNKQVQDFLAEIEEFDLEKAKIMRKIRRMVLEFFPRTSEEIKYGGIVFLAGKDLFGGIFARTNHISLEFGRGAKMNDPKKLLEGSGKFRRHLKIRSLSDIKDKDVEFFIKQALK